MMAMSLAPFILHMLLAVHAVSAYRSPFVRKRSYGRLDPKTERSKGFLPERSIFGCIMPLSDSTCLAIKAAVSSASAVYKPCDARYTADTTYYCQPTASPVCVVEPGSVSDVSAILRILAGSSSQFAIRGSGHSCAGFSSTNGVLIAMTRFRNVNYNSAVKTVDLGPGLTWDDVYSALDPLNVQVVGGRVSGVGIAGFTLGGGFSFLTSQYGLTSDNTVAYELVTPDGSVLQVTKGSNPDLFFGLRGGFNNFGIVTKFTLKTYPTAGIWGGAVMFQSSQISQFLTAITDFASKNTDPKAVILPTLNAIGVITILEAQLFYDGPKPPAGTFDRFWSLQTTSNDTKTRSWTDFIRSAPSNTTSGLRGAFSSVSLASITPDVLSVIQADFLKYGVSTWGLGNLFVSYAIEPFSTLSSYPAASDSAWPHDRRSNPINIYFGWPVPVSTDLLLGAIKQTTSNIMNAATNQKQDIGSLYTYPNYALSDATFTSVYGSNVARLTTIAQKYDPKKVMARSAGFMFQKGQNK